MMQVTETIFLHIGTEKTGTTTLQAVAGINRDLLLREGLFYPEAPGNRNHVGLALYASETPNLDLRRTAGLFSEDSLDAFRNKFPRELKSEIEASGSPRVFLCNEHLSSRVRRSREVERIATLLRPIAKNIKVTVYLRRQDELFQSHYSTTVKSGRKHELDPPANAQNRYYNYELLLAPWAEIFGEENINVRIYDRKTLLNGDVVSDLFALMSIPEGAVLQRNENRNQRLDHTSLQFLMAMNQYLPLSADDVLNPERGDLTKAIESASRGVPFSVPAATRRGIMELFEPSNAEVARRYLGRADGKLFADVEYEDATGTETLTVERAVEIAACLWRWKQQQLTETRRKLIRLRKRRTAQRGRLGNEIAEADTSAEVE